MTGTLNVLSKHSVLSSNVKIIPNENLGSPVPANILTVSIQNLPTQLDEISLAEDFWKVLRKHRPDEMEIWDIYTRQLVYSVAPDHPKWDGGIYACVHFKNVQPNFRIGIHPFPLSSTTQLKLIYQICPRNFPWLRLDQT
jgi:hypothetical protein